MLAEQCSLGSAQRRSRRFLDSACTARFRTTSHTSCLPVVAREEPTHMDAIQFLKQEHRKAKGAFAGLLEADPDKREELWEELQPELKAHEEIEEACLYGPLS